MTAFALDEALALRLGVDDLRAQKTKRRGQLPPGTRYATDAEQGVDDIEAAMADSQAAA